MKIKFLTIASFILCLMFSTCQKTHPEFELDWLFIKAKEKTDPYELEKFSSTHREIAIVNHDIFNNKVYFPFSEILLDSLPSSKYSEFWKQKKLDDNGLENEFILLTAYHAWLNEEVIVFEEIKEEAYRYFQLWKEKEYYEFLKDLVSMSYFKFFIPYEDSIRIILKKKISGMSHLNEEQKEYYYLKALDSVITDGMERGLYSYDDWVTYKNKKELDHLMELFGEEDLPCQ